MLIKYELLYFVYIFTKIFLENFFDLKLLKNDQIHVACSDNN